MSVSLRMFKHLADDRSCAVGALGEFYAKRLLEGAGYVVFTGEKGQHAGDLVACDGMRSLLIEVKTSRLGADGRWRFTLQKNDSFGVTDFRQSDYVLLLLVMRSGRCDPYLIPVSRIAPARKHICISSHPDKYRGKWSEFRVRGRLSLAEQDAAY